MASTAKYAPGRSRARRPDHRTARPPVRSRRLGLIGALLFAVLALTGCVTVQLNATVHPDGTLSGTARYGVAKSLAAFAGGQNQLLNQLKSQGSCDFGSRQGSVKDFDDGTYIGIECAFSGITMAEFNSGEGGPKLAKVGNEFRLTGRLDLLQALSEGSNGLLGGSSGAVPFPSALPSLPSGIPTDLNSLLPSGIPTDLLPSGIPTDLLPSGIPTDLLPSGIPTDLNSLLPSGLPSAGLPSLDPSSLLRTAKVSFAFTFPGKVISSRGKINGHKVTFTPNSAGVINFQTTASAVPSSTSGLTNARWLVLAGVILVLLAAAGLLIRRRRTTAGQPAAGYPMAGDYPPGYPMAGDYPPGYPYQGEQYPGQPYPGERPPYAAAQPPPYPAASQPYAGPPPTLPYPSQQPYPPTQPYPTRQPGPYEQYPTQQYPAGHSWSAPTAPNPWADPGQPPGEPGQQPPGEPGQQPPG